MISEAEHQALSFPKSWGHKGNVTHCAAHRGAGWTAENTSLAFPQNVPCVYPCPTWL